MNYVQGMYVQYFHVYPDVDMHIYIYIYIYIRAHVGQVLFSKTQYFNLSAFRRDTFFVLFLRSFPRELWRT